MWHWAFICMLYIPIFLWIKKHQDHLLQFECLWVMNRQCRLFVVEWQTTYIGLLHLRRRQAETIEVLQYGADMVMSELSRAVLPVTCTAVCHLALQASLIVLFCLFLLGYKLTDLLETSTNLAVSFTFQFYCRLFHFSRLCSQTSHELCEPLQFGILFTFPQWLFCLKKINIITLQLVLPLICWKNLYLHCYNFSHKKYC